MVNEEKGGSEEKSNGRIVKNKIVLLRQKLINLSNFQVRFVFNLIEITLILDSFRFFEDIEHDFDIFFIYTFNTRVTLILTSKNFIRSFHIESSAITLKIILTLKTFNYTCCSSSFLSIILRIFLSKVPG